MGTFAYYLVAAMIELNPPSKWEDIAEKALLEMNCSEGRKKYCTDELRKALEVAIRFGTIKKLDDKYYLYEYGVVDAEGDITYQLEHILFDDEEDSETDSMIENELTTLTHEFLKETQLNHNPIIEMDLQLIQSSLVGPITRDFLQNYVIRIEDNEQEEASNMDEPREYDNELVEDDDMSEDEDLEDDENEDIEDEENEDIEDYENEDLEDYEMSTFSVSENDIGINDESESISSDSEDDLLVANNKRKCSSAPEIMVMPKKPRHDM